MTRQELYVRLLAETVPVMLKHYINNRRTGPEYRIGESVFQHGNKAAEFAADFIESYYNKAFLAIEDLGGFTTHNSEDNV